MDTVDQFTSEETSRALIVDLGKRLYDRGFVAANDGNISVRLDNDWILATPTGVSKGFMKPDQMVKVHLLNEEWRGYLKPSTEIKMHREIYLVRDDVRAVVHAHPPVSTAFSVAGIPLDKSILAEVIISLGTIPLASYQTPSTRDFARQIGAYIKSHDAVLLANHGAVTVGQDLLQAHYRMETLEHYAHICWIVRQLGQENALNFDQIRELINMRSTTYGIQSPPDACLACPNFPEPDQPGPVSPEPAPQPAPPTQQSVNVQAIVRKVLDRMNKS